MNKGFAALFVLTLILAGCGRTDRSVERVEDPFSSGHYKLGSAYTIKGKTYRPRHDPDYVESGIASWYGDAFHAKTTANGETFDKNLMTAAHKTLALPSFVRVTNLENGRVVDLRVNDRGPFVDNRIIDVSEAAAKELGFHNQGLARVRVEYLSLASSRGKPPEEPRSSHLTNTPIEKPASEVSGIIAAQTVSVCPERGHYVQLGAFSDDDRAVLLSDRLKASGYSGIVLFLDPQSNLHKVRVGPYTSVSVAQENRIRLMANGFDGALIIDDGVQSVGCT